jgi:thymidine kinase
MVNLITGPKGSGKTQQIIELANQKVIHSSGNVVLVKKSHRDTYSVDFKVRAICMDDYKDITSMDEFVGFLYGMVAGNHDIQTIFIDGALKHAGITVDNLPFFLEKLNRVSKQDNIEFYLSVSVDKKELGAIADNTSDYHFINQ